MSAGAAPGGSLGSLQEVEGALQRVKGLPRLFPGPQLRALAAGHGGQVQALLQLGRGRRHRDRLVAARVEPHPLLRLRRRNILASARAWHGGNFFFFINVDIIIVGRYFSANSNVIKVQFELER